jgi:hypothetical protein
MMRYYGRTAISEFLDDRVVYRNLVPIDPRLPSLEALRGLTGLAPGITPRKTTTEYARVISRILVAAQQVDSPGIPIKRVIFIGDTLLNDSTAFMNICQAGDWLGLAFIGAEVDAPLKIDIKEMGSIAVMHANRWIALGSFENYCREGGFLIDRSTAVLLDLDKTTIGARGRNDQVINQARVEAATQTIRDVLGVQFDPESFQDTYDTFNQVEFHPFTTDNQDYLVYICLIVGSGLYQKGVLVKIVENGALADFEAFLQAVDRRSAQLPPKIKAMHQDVFNRVQNGDPTPFKAFREAEYLATVDRMGKMGQGSPVGELLSREIVITYEVRELMLAWRERGCLLFGLSDKPDEASIPTPDLESRGYKPIHRIEASMVGENQL